MVYSISATDAILGEAKNSVHNNCHIFTEEASLGQPNPDGLVCVGSCSERPLIGSRTTKEIGWTVESLSTYRGYPP